MVDVRHEESSGVPGGLGRRAVRTTIMVAKGRRRKLDAAAWSLCSLAVHPRIEGSTLRRMRCLFTAILSLTCLGSRAHAQGAAGDSSAALAVADSVLAALTSGDGSTLTRLTLDSAVVGGSGVRNGVERLSLRNWSLYRNRTGASDFTERGFDATARVQDRVAQVWMPYDLYIGDKWSHCGVDVFTLMKSGGRWRVAALIFSIEQPPACRPHPSGAPKK
jgi:hypothetical protein